MATYEGGATLIIPDCGRVAVDVRLHTGEAYRGSALRNTWSGNATAVDGTSLFDVLGRTIDLELPDGRTGRAVINSGDLGLTVGLAGSGPPPF